jgi:amino acid transporter
MVLVLVAAGAGAVRFELPLTVAISVLLAVLVVSYRQVIAVHPDGGGAYAVAKASLGRRASLLAAASLVVDYVLTVAVSLAAGAASLISTFPTLGNHPLLYSLVGLALLATLNLRGIVDSARALMLPTLVFIVGIVVVIVAGLVRARPEHLIGHGLPLHTSEAVGVILLMKAFAAGCSALTGVEAIGNAVPTFREPRVRRAQMTELLLGVLLAAMLLGLAIVIHRFHLVPRGGVTLLAQLTAAALGTGLAFHAVGIAVTVVLLLAANTSYGGLPVLMSRLSHDNRLPHLFSLRAEHQVYRYGVAALTLAAALLLVVVGGDTQRLIPLFAIGVFIGFTISQAGLVRHWAKERPRNWQTRALVNGFGAVLTATATIIFLIAKFTEGAWIIVLIVPGLILLFNRIESYYDYVAIELALGQTPPPPVGGPSLVIVPVMGVSRLTFEALSAARSLGNEVVAISVQHDEDSADALRRQWQAWECGIHLEILTPTRRELIEPITDYVNNAVNAGNSRVAVLIPELEPRRRRHQILQNQRGILLAAALRRHTGAVICILPYRLRE